MSDLHRQQSTAMSQDRSSKSEEHLQETTQLSTPRADPTPPQSTAASISSQSDSASRRSCGLGFASMFTAKRRELLDARRRSKSSKEVPCERSFVVLSGRKLQSPFSDAASSGPASQQPHFPEPMAPVGHPGPLVMQHPARNDSGVGLPGVVSIPALPSFGEISPSSLLRPTRELRRGGNNQKRDHPRRRFDSARNYRQESLDDLVHLCVAAERRWDADHIQRAPSVHSMEAEICSAEDSEAFEGIHVGSSLAEDTTAFQQPYVPAASDFNEFMSQRTVSNGIESITAFNQPPREPSTDFSRWSESITAFNQPSRPASNDFSRWSESITAFCQPSSEPSIDFSRRNESITAFNQPSRLASDDFSRWSAPAQSFAANPFGDLLNHIEDTIALYRSISDSPSLYSDIGGDVSLLDLDEAEPAEVLPLPVSSAMYEPHGSELPYAPSADVDDDPEPYFPPELAGMQFVLPRRRPREVRPEA
ncbi:uncharacterized protein CLAFUR5_10234 [Fulvia fulva]|uniref:Uncharacterized protein n=1 Tax=Passalora fulva TaxID=5499 RepID=A0A9Q8PD53_PASFU|nr:uncharacterized protein CLAFUR5_10234 [Fulvia fulva]UJO20250.1 hypothetical protein CLAFUR5_10234 [Fulvia fulva]